MRKSKPTNKATGSSSPIVNNKTASSISSTTTTTTTKVVENSKRKNEFNSGILTCKKDSLNNLLFTSDRWDQTIELINGAKLKRYCDRNEKEISLLKTYNIINAGSQQKLVKKMNSSEE
ncbi:unnamed protein product [Rotaria magnacalcarata]|uniref:Uncharacterized protein n=1 Tax=Rotaria magnacalcarata TaxID=392030 RepID=A0A820RSA2_9BILA|nr:unnamed protein product [Rotaria magnacalcarata]CAF4441672.1 unnamed protein product [Rotaria magnacalcarata]